MKVELEQEHSENENQSLSENESLSDSDNSNGESKVTEEKDQESKNSKKPKSTHSKSTLFVSTLPFTATNEELEEFFSEIGPVRSCFVLKKDGKCNGCGYVQYALPEDAERALVELKKKKFKGKRTLKIVKALKKATVLERKTKGIPLNLEEVESKKKELDKVLSKRKVVSKVQQELSKTILIENLPSVTKNVLNKKVRKFGTVVEIDLEKSSAKVVYETVKEAENALKHLDNHIYKGVTIKCKFIKTVTEAATAKKARLIIRNLAFNCKKENLEKVFEVYGEIADITIPTKNGHSRGFGFVQMKSVEDAQKAIDGLNGKNILSRPVAVDWALAKSQYDRMAAEENEKSGESESEEEEVEEEPENMEVDEDEAIIDNIDEDSDEDSELEDPTEIEESTLFVRNLSFNTTKEELYRCFQKWGPLRYALVTLDKVTKLSKGNGFVSFKQKADCETCLEDFEKAQGLIASGGLDAPKEEEVKLKKNSILKPSIPTRVVPETEKFTIDSRFVSVTPTVSRDIANKISHASALSRRAMDKRHLYLMKEGVVFPNTEAAKLLSPQEMDQRMAQFANRKRLLTSNPNLFISRTRLSIRGLHTRITDTHLKLAGKKAVQGFWDDVQAKKRQPLEQEIIDEEIQEGFKAPSPERKVVIKQAKVIREVDKIDPSTQKLKSRGYGFIEFASHADAIASLRFMNNNNQLFTDILNADIKEFGGKVATKKLMVEFAVENKLVLRRRELRNKNPKEGVAKESKGESNKKRKRTDANEDQEPKAKKAKEPRKDDQEGGRKKKLTFSERRAIRKEKEREKIQVKKSENSEKDAPIKRQHTPIVSKKKSDRPSVREVKRAKKDADEEKFQSLVTSFKKKLLEPSEEKKVIKNKWYA